MTAIWCFDDSTIIISSSLTTWKKNILSVSVRYYNIFLKIFCWQTKKTNIREQKSFWIRRSNHYNYYFERYIIFCYITQTYNSRLLKYFCRITPNVTIVYYQTQAHNHLSRFKYDIIIIYYRYRIDYI